MNATNDHSLKAERAQARGMTLGDAQAVIRAAHQAEIAHGTVRGYFGGGCRCDRCKAAQVEHQQGKAIRGQRGVIQALRELKAEGCICPLEFRPGDGGLIGTNVRECPVHFPPAGGGS